jgi:hypothetical protein
MASFTRSLSQTNVEAQKTCLNEVERFFLWGQGLSVPDGDLEEVLAFSKELHLQVLSLLLRLGTAVLHSTSQIPAPVSQHLTAQRDDLRVLLETTEAVLRQPDPDDAARPDSPTPSDLSDAGLIDTVDEISVYVDCLLDLSPSLDKPALDLQTGGDEEGARKPTEAFSVSSEEAQLYCRKIWDRFEALPKYLVERLAEANVRRAAALRDFRSRAAKADFVDDISENLFSTTDGGPSKMTKSGAVSSSVFSSVPGLALSGPSKVPAAETDDSASFATFATLSSLHPRPECGVPASPMLEPQGQWIDCPICCSSIANVASRDQWK